MRDTWRSDEKPEEKIFFQSCTDCSWEDAESWDTEENADRRDECPECESKELSIENGFV